MNLFRIFRDTRNHFMNKVAEGSHPNFASDVKRI